MSWREESKFVSEKEANEKEFMRLAKKVREIIKIEKQPGGPQANQKHKIEEKDTFVDMLLSVPGITGEFWQKHMDVFEDGLTKAQQAPLLVRFNDEKTKKDAKAAADKARREEFKIKPEEERRREIVSC